MPWVDIAEAAFTLGVSERTIRNWIKSGKLEARNMDGRREVNIPEAEETERAHAYNDDDGEGTGLDTQKRLEVALIECGRVKGTLASQERMMESLSSNIAELNAKLQRSERTIGLRTIYCLIIALIAVTTILLVRYFDEAKLSQAQINHRDEQILKAETHSTEMTNLREAHQRELANAQNDFQEKMKKQREELETKRGQALVELENRLSARYEAEIARIQKTLEKVQAAHDQAKKEFDDAKMQLALKEKMLELAETQLAGKEERVSELEKTRQELEAEVVRLRAGN